MTGTPEVSPTSSTYAFDAPLLLMAAVLVVNLPLALPFGASPAPDLPARVAAVEDSIAGAEAERDRASRARERERGALEERDRLDAERSALEEESGRLDRELADRLADAARLEEELDALRLPSAGAVAGAPAVVATDADPVVVSVTDNRILELNPSNYRFELVRSSDDDPVVAATRTGDGDAIEDLRRPSSAIAQLLDAMDPAEQYLALLVWSDSFEAFRAVRDAARSRGIGVGWEPMQGEEDRILLGRSGGRTIDVQEAGATRASRGR